MKNLMFIEFHKRVCQILLCYYRTNDISPDDRDYLNYYAKAEINELMDNINIEDMDKKVDNIISDLLTVMKVLYKEHDLFYQGYKCAFQDLKKEMRK